MTTTVSRPVQVFAVLGILATVGFAGFTFLAGSGDASTAPPPATPVSPVAPVATPSTPSLDPAPVAPAARRPATTATRSGFPLPVDRALRKKRTVVVAVYLPRASVDLVVKGEAQAAAAATGAGFVAVSAADEQLVRSLVGKIGIVPDPAVLVVRRPGVVVAQLGVTDRGAIAQAVAQARR